MQLEPFLIALLGGSAFGWLAIRLHMSTAHCAVMLIALALMQTLPQQVFRALDGGTLISHELVYVLTLRAAFVGAALLVMGLRR